jgi:hypothetical protein
LISTTFDYSKHQNEIIEKIINFVYEHLSIWRDRLISPYNKNENELTADLSKLLNIYARNKNLPFIISHQEHQGKKRTIDISVYPYNEEIYDEIIIVFECKRLTEDISGKRKDEYVTGHKKTSGGIQRFKLEVHGQCREIVGMIGYMQTGTFQDWKNKINCYIVGLSRKPDENDLIWNIDEQLTTIKHDNEKKRYHAKSIHRRKTKSNITIHHLWIDMLSQDS